MSDETAKTENEGDDTEAHMRYREPAEDVEAHMPPRSRRPESSSVLRKIHQPADDAEAKRRHVAAPADDVEGHNLRSRGPEKNV